MKMIQFSIYIRASPAASPHSHQLCIKPAPVPAAVSATVPAAVLATVPAAVRTNVVVLFAYNTKPLHDTVLVSVTTFARTSVSLRNFFDARNVAPIARR